MTNSQILRPEIAPDEAGNRADKWLALKSGLPRSQVKALILTGQMRCDGKTIRDPDKKISAGENYALTIPPPVEAIAQPENIPLSILYEDEHLIALDKPPGLVTHPAPGAWSGTLVNALLHHCGDSLSGIGGVCRPGIVHRLDKDTSGVMIAAKTQAVHAALCDMFRDHRIDKTYLALTIGSPVPAEGVVETKIGRSSHDRRKMAATTSKTGKHAITHYKLMTSYGQNRHTSQPVAALLECRPQTGRTHQIRVHMSHLGVPLIGDALYGGRRGIAMPGSGAAAIAACQAARAFPRQALHAYRLSFTHPATGKGLQFETPPPADFAELVDQLRQTSKATD